MVWSASEQVCTRRGASRLPLLLPCRGALPARHSLGSTRRGQRTGSLSGACARSIKREVVQAIVGATRLGDYPREAAALNVTALTVWERNRDAVL